MIVTKNIKDVGAESEQLEFLMAKEDVKVTAIKKEITKKVNFKYQRTQVQPNEISIRILCLFHTYGTF